jgi:hypothetical protein
MKSFREFHRQAKRVAEKRTRRVRTKPHRLRKWLHQRMQPCDSSHRRLALIVGCQRSGTSMLGRIFEEDLNSAVLHEDSCITGNAESRLRLKSFDEVNHIIDSLPARLVVAKPLVESQNTTEMLRRIPRSKAIWVFRNYRDVVRSSLSRFRGQIEHLRVAISPPASDWRAENVSESTRRILAGLFSEDISRANAAALFWYARNRLYFEQDLANHPEATVCQYEQLVATPSAVTRKLYDFLGCDYPKRNLTRGIDALSLDRGADIELDAEIDALCSELYQQLCESLQSRAETAESVPGASQPLNV